MARKWLTAIDLAKNELQNAVVQNLAAAPSSPVKGQLYFDSTGNILYWYNGTAWVSASGGSVSFGTITQEQTFGAVKNDGAATTAARSDHTHGNPTHVDADHAAIHLNALAAATADYSMGGFKITSLGTPIATTDAANKSYVDSLTQGLSWKDSVKAATTANIALTGLQTIDGVALGAAQRVLVKNQTTGTENGIYLAASGAWTRTTDADLGSELLGGAMFVEEGTTQADTAWVCTTDSPATIGSTVLTFVQFGSSSVAANSVDNTKLADMATMTIKGNNAGSTGDPIDLSRPQVAAMFRTYWAFAFSVACAGALSTTVNHNMNTQSVLVDVWRATTPWDTVECDVERTTVNSVTVRFAVAPAAGEYNITVVGQ